MGLKERIVQNKKREKNETKDGEVRRGKCILLYPEVACCKSVTLHRMHQITQN